MHWTHLIHYGMYTYIYIYYVCIDCIHGDTRLQHALDLALDALARLHGARAAEHQHERQVVRPVPQQDAAQGEGTGWGAGLWIRQVLVGSRVEGRRKG